MANPAPIYILHKIYISTSDAKPETENKRFETFIPGVYHTFHGRGDTVSVNSSAAQYQIAKGPFLKALTSLFLPLLYNKIFHSVPLSREINCLIQVGNAIWDTLRQHSDTCPTWITYAAMARQLVIRPWIAYRIDVALRIIVTGQRESEEQNYRDAFLRLITKEPLPPHLNKIYTGRTARCAHFIRGLLGTHSIVALSYSRTSFREANCLPYRDNLAKWIKKAWENTSWGTIGFNNRQQNTNRRKNDSIGNNLGEENVPMLWLDAFGMDGVSKFEENEWAKFSLFTYSLCPVLTHVPTVKDWDHIVEDEQRATEENNDYKHSPNEIMFHRLDSKVWQFARHVSSCQRCTEQLSEVQKRVLFLWKECDQRIISECNTRGAEKPETVRLLHYFRVWPVIERSMALYVNRLLVEAHAWRAIFHTYCLGLLALDWITSNNRVAPCKDYGDSATQMIETMGLTYFRGLLHHLGDEARLAIPTTHDEHVPRERKVKCTRLQDFVVHADISQIMRRAYPVLSGQIPTVQIRGGSYEKNKKIVERFDRRFIMLLAEAEPNQLDAAYLRTGLTTKRHDPLIVERIDARISGRPEKLYPTEYMRNWLDDLQMTNFAWKMSRHMWYASRMAPGLPRCDAGHSYVTSRVSPVLVKSILDMVPEAMNAKVFEQRRVVVCPVVGLDVSAVGCDLSASKAVQIAQVGGKSYAAFAMRSYSYQSRCSNTECLKFSYTCHCRSIQMEYCHDIALCEDTGELNDDGKKIMTTLFAVILCGREVHSEMGTTVRWVVAGDDKETGSLLIARSLKAVPLIVKDGLLLSLHFMSTTSSKLMTHPKDHIPFKLITGPTWGEKWEHVGLRVEKRDCTELEMNVVIQ